MHLDGWIHLFGNFIWVKAIMGNSVAYVHGLEIDSNGDIYLVGEYKGTYDFDPGTGTAIFNAGMYDVYAIKLSHLGMLGWAKIIVEYSVAYGKANSIDSYGNLYSLGYFYYSADFEPGFGTNNLFSAGGYDTFISKLNTCSFIPSINTSSSSSICSGTNAVLSVLSNASSYQWKKNGNNISGATTSTYIATTSGSYTVLVTTSCGAFTTAPFNLTVNTNPNSTISVTGATTFCVGDSVMLNTPYSPNRSYQWKKNGVIIQGANSNKLTIKASGTYKAIVTNTNTGCSSTTSNGIVVTVYSKPSAAFTANGPTTYCAGGSSLTLTATAVGLNFQWIKNNIDISGANGQTYNVSTGGTYKLRVTNANGCSNTSSGLKITINPLPSSTVIASGPLSFCTGDSVVLTASSGSGVAYQWRRNGNNILGATNINYTAKTAGIYKVIITKSTTGCSILSSGNVVSVPCKQNEYVDAGFNDIYIYPNPSTGIFTIKTDAIIFEGSLLIYDIYGKEFYKIHINNSSQMEINLKNISPGIYFLKLFEHEKTYCGKVVIQD